MCHEIRKLQRANEELQEQIDSLQIQTTHLQTRLVGELFNNDLSQIIKKVHRMNCFQTD